MQNFEQLIDTEFEVAVSSSLGMRMNFDVQSSIWRELKFQAQVWSKSMKIKFEVEVDIATWILKLKIPCEVWIFSKQSLAPKYLN